MLRPVALTLCKPQIVACLSVLRSARRRPPLIQEASASFAYLEMMGDTPSKGGDGEREDSHFWLLLAFSVGLAKPDSGSVTFFDISHSLLHGGGSD